MMIDLTLVDYNPYRDETIDPIDDARVVALAQNVTDLGFWGGVAVREAGERYQLAFGHHRFEALKLLGWTEADLNIVEFDDFQMVRAMHRENALQRKGVTTAIESVGAAIRVLGPAILEGNTDSVSKIFETEITQNALNSAKGNLEKGNGLGEPIIQAFYSTGAGAGVDDISLGDIREAKATLVATGAMRGYMLEMSQRAEGPLAEAAKMAAEKMSPSTVDPACISLFKDYSTTVWTEVRKKLAGDGFQSLHAVEDQVEVCRALKDFAEKQQREALKDKFAGLVLTANGKDPSESVKKILGAYIACGGRWLREIRPRAEVVRDDVGNAFRTFRAAALDMRNSIPRLVTAIEEEVPTKNDVDFGPEFQETVRTTIESLEDLATAAGSVVSNQ